MMMLAKTLILMMMVVMVMAMLWLSAGLHNNPQTGAVRACVPWAQPAPVPYAPQECPMVICALLPCPIAIICHTHTHTHAHAHRDTHTRAHPHAHMLIHARPLTFALPGRSTPQVPGPLQHAVADLLLLLASALSAACKAGVSTTAVPACTPCAPVQVPHASAASAQGDATAVTAAAQEAGLGKALHVGGRTSEAGAGAAVCNGQGGGAGRRGAAAGAASVFADRWPAHVVVRYVCETLEHCVPLVRGGGGGCFMRRWCACALCGSLCVIPCLCARACEWMNGCVVRERMPCSKSVSCSRPYGIHSARDGGAQPPLPFCPCPPLTPCSSVRPAAPHMLAGVLAIWPLCQPLPQQRLPWSAMPTRIL